MARHLPDKTAAAVALILLSPVLLIAAIGIKLSDRGPVIYRSRRAGRHGRPFSLYKFRTMRVGGETGSAITASGDSRVFPFGRWLRWTKIDELPQLVNILRGDMAIVGPRPEDPRIVKDHYTAEQMDTLSVVPGLVGPGSLYNFTHGEALLSEGNAEKRYVETVLPTKLALDLVYVREASWQYDLQIVLRTVGTLVAAILGRRRFGPSPEMERLGIEASSPAPRGFILLRIPFVLRRLLIVVVHLVLVALTNVAAFALRFDGNVPPAEVRLCLITLPWLIAVRGLIFVPFRLYSGLWRYVSVWDLRNIATAIATSTVAYYILIRWIFQYSTYPRSIFIIDALLLLVAVGGIRLVTRLRLRRVNASGRKRVLIYGAGDAGEMIVRDMNRHTQYRPIGFVDDDATKVGQRIHGVPVLGTRDELAKIMEREHPHEVLIAVRRTDPAVMRGLVEALRPFKVRLTTLPNPREILDGGVQVSQIRTVSIEDLLSRAPIGLDMSRVRELLVGKRVMVTGAGGSIGSELSRQIAALSPASLILYERYENGLYEIANDLIDKVGFRAFHTAVGDITDERRLNNVMGTHRPHIVFHAAAHKHVPLMEMNVCEAIKNNVTGTRTLAEAADRFGVERFVLISSDKAVNPTSVMGTTKRVAEMLVQSFNSRLRGRFVAVRFGNVLGSSGSVVPRFLDQISRGGPVTVTHPEIRRYFMMIPEAVQLVLQAATLGDHGELFVLDMGEQISIDGMARNLIQLAGHVPGVDIAIEYTGLRPGEKLYEEVVGTEEALEPSTVEKILRIKPGAAVVPELLAYQLAELEAAAGRDDVAASMEQLAELVHTFKTPEVPGRDGATVRRRSRKSAVMIRRRFTSRSPFEYVQVVVDRRDATRSDRRLQPRGGRRANDEPIPTVGQEPAMTGTGHN
jgi:FlaA1/EpsC-like NDP-sugar epimerase/lipopolysaccharide/colanic/teichoic acid biosynthesis glycosyltransferase